MQPSDPEEKGPWSKIPHAQVQARRSTVVGRSQRGSEAARQRGSEAARQQERRPQTLATREGARGTVGRCERKMEEAVGKQRAGQVFIPRESGEWGALPEVAGPNRKRPRLTWRQERAGISPGRILFYKLSGKINKKSHELK